MDLLFRRLIAGFLGGVVFMYAGTHLVIIALGAGDGLLRAIMAGTFGLAILAAILAATTRRSWGRVAFVAAFWLVAVPLALAAFSAPMAAGLEAPRGAALPGDIAGVAMILAAMLSLPAVLNAAARLVAAARRGAG